MVAAVITTRDDKAVNLINFTLLYMGLLNHVRWKVQIKVNQWQPFMVQGQSFQQIILNALHELTIKLKISYQKKSNFTFFHFKSSMFKGP